jgi:hypothetical protein
MSYDIMVDQTHDLAEDVCRRLHMYFVGASAYEKERYARWVKLELEKEDNDIDEIMNLGRELQDIGYDILERRKGPT